MKFERVKLGDVCNIVSGSTPPTNIPEYWNGEYNWVAPNELNEDTKYIFSTNKKITKLAVEKAGLKLLPVGTVLLSSRAPIGKVAIAGSPMYCNQGFKNLICSDKIYNEFLYWYLVSKKNYLNSIGRGATFKELSKTLVESVIVPLPDLRDQRSIAAILDKVDAICRKRKECIKMLDELVQARFVEMFGTFPANEKEWKVCKIGDIVTDVKYGTSRPANKNGKYKYLRMNNITYDGELDISDIKYIDIPENELPKCTVKFGDVLFNRTNSKELVGKTCVYNLEETMVLAGFIIRLRVKNLVLPEFLSAFMNTGFSKRMLLGMCRAAIGQANINAQELKNIKLYLPPICEQGKFVSLKNKIEETKSIMQSQLQEAENLKGALMQQYFSQPAEDKICA